MSISTTTSTQLPRVAAVPILAYLRGPLSVDIPISWTPLLVEALYQNERQKLPGGISTDCNTALVLDDDDDDIREPEIKKLNLSFINVSTF